MDLLSIVRLCHNDDPWADNTLTPFYLGHRDQNGVQIGFLTDAVVQAIQDDADAERSRAFTVIRGKSGHAQQKAAAVCIHSALQSRKAISDALRAVVEDWRDRNMFPDPLNGWRNELYAIYGSEGKVAFELERAACALFGLATFGVHATAYTLERHNTSTSAANDETLRIWVPRRSKTKSTWPGYLDNSVAGGITSGDLPWDSMVRECQEEASLSPEVVCKGMRQTGVISYFYRTKSRWCQPEVEYTYDILLDSAVQLTPADGEAESFELMTVDQVMALMRQGEFKPNCALVLIDFLIRHGQLTAENCGCDYTQLVCSLHNDLRLPGPK